LRCGEMACASYLQACETAARPATTASIGSSTAEMKRSPRPQSRANDRFGSRSNQAADLEVRPPCRLCMIPLLEGGCYGCNRSLALVTEKNSNNLFPVSEKTLPLNS
jgi:hypothetical protein